MTDLIGQSVGSAKPRLDLVDGFGYGRISSSIAGRHQHIPPIAIWNDGARRMRGRDHIANGELLVDHKDQSVDGDQLLGHGRFIAVLGRSSNFDDNHDWGGQQ